MQPPVVRARAPLRLGLAGGGTDVEPYCTSYGGRVLNATIDLYARVSIKPRDDGLVKLHALDGGGLWSGPISPPLPLDGHVDLLKAVYNRACAEMNGGKGVALTIETSADVPPGSGLGTSSALVVALVEAFRHFFSAPLGAYDVAHLAYEIERVDVGLAGGKQDQYAAAFGGVNFIEFGPGDSVLVNPLRMERAVISEFESSLILCFIGVSRASAKIIEQQSASVRGGDAGSIEAMHQLKSGAGRMKEALLRGQIGRLAELLDEGYVQKKRTSSAVATARSEEVYRVAKAAGALGGKISGAGGGGFMMFLADPVCRHEVIRALVEFGGEIFPCGLTSRGAHAWSVEQGIATERGGWRP